MLNFYKKAITVLVGLLAVSVLLLFGALKHTFISQSLLPRGDSELPWRASPEDDTSQGGASEAIVLDDTYGLEYDLFIAPKAQSPAARWGWCLPTPRASRAWWT